MKDRAEDAGVGDYSDTVRDEAVQNPKGNAQKDGSDLRHQTALIETESTITVLNNRI